MNTKQSKAKELRDLFEYKTREDGSGYYCFKLEVITSKSPLYLKASDLLHELQDETDEDSAYRLIVHALDYMIENEGASEDDSSSFADGSVDIYNSDLTTWLAKNTNNIQLVDDALSELGSSGGIIQAIRHAQYMHADSVFTRVYSLIEELNNDQEK